jgi:hypothetical protein
MRFSKVTSLDALCDTTTSFDDEPCDHQKEGSCPRVVESDTLGEREKKNLPRKRKSRIVSLILQRNLLFTKVS